MQNRQALGVTAVVGRAAHVTIDPRRIAVASRRRAPSVASASDFADLIVEVGRDHHLTYLRRELGASELLDLIARGTTPLVVLTPGTEGGYRALVITGARARDLDVTSIDEASAEHTETMTPERLREVIGTGRAFVLVPLAIDPSVSAGTGEETPDGAVHLTPVQRLIRLLGHEKRYIAYIYLYAGLAGLFGLTLPLGVQAIIGLVSGGMIFQPVILLIAFVIVGTLANGGLQIMQLSVVEMVQQRVFARFAFELGARIPRLRLDVVSESDLPELMNRFFEIKTIQKSLSKLLTDWVTAMLQVFFGLVLLTFYHPYFSLFGLGLLATLAFIFFVTAPRGLETSLAESKYKYKVAHWLEELARNLRLMKLAGRSALAIERTDQEVAGYLTNRKAHFRVLVRQSWAFVIFKTAIAAGLLILGSMLVVDRSITLGQFVASEIVIVTVLLAIEKLILGLADFYDLLTAVEKAGHITDLPVEPGMGVAVRGGGDARGLLVETRDLTFTYPGGDRPAIDGLTLRIAPGERLAITGAEGAGESTLLNIVGGLLGAYRGAVTYDGLSLRELDATRAREVVGYCGDPVELFDGTVEENIAIGRSHVRTEDVLDALSAVGLHEWIQEQPAGLQSPVSSEGRGLPSQVTRKLVLARAIVGQPRLLLFDDFFDSLDPAAKRELIPFIMSREAPWTMVAVTHDAHVLAACDRVLVLRDGRVASDGAYATLMREDPYFRELAQVE